MSFPPSRAFAPAKINLTLAVTGRREDGYHDLESLVVFADIGDEVAVTATPATPAEPGASLRVEGPFAAQLLEAAGDLDTLSPLVAARALARACGQEAAGVALTLTKRLPIASGLGGGSADAAATLRALDEGWSLATPLGALARFAGRVCGADAPACVVSRPLVMRGLGDVIAPLRAWPSLPVVLVNPGRPVSTPTVFAAIAARGGPYAQPAHTLYHADTMREALGVIDRGANDLTNAAVAVEPAIADVLALLTAETDCLLARMSGSGGTCFGIFPHAEAASAAATRIAAARSGWWVRAGRTLGVNDTI